MNNVSFKYINMCLFLLCIGCNDTTKYNHFQKVEIENIGISFPISAKCLFFEDSSGQRIRIYKEWVLSANTPFIFSKELNSSQPWLTHWDEQLIAKIINRLAGEEIIQFDSIEKFEYKSILRKDGVEIRIERLDCRNKYFLHLVFIKN